MGHAGESVAKPTSTCDESTAAPVSNFVHVSPLQEGILNVKVMPEVRGASAQTSPGFMRRNMDASRARANFAMTLGI